MINPAASFALGFPLLIGALAALYSTKNASKMTVLPVWRLVLNATLLSAQGAIVAIMFIFLATINLSAFTSIPLKDEATAIYFFYESYFFFVLLGTAILGTVIGYVRVKRSRQG